MTEAARLAEEAKGIARLASQTRHAHIAADHLAALDEVINRLATLAQAGGDDAWQPAMNGWKLVPMKPTSEMIDAAVQTINNRKNYGTKGHTLGQMLAEEFIAMVHAAPKPSLHRLTDSALPGEDGADNREKAE